MLTNKEFEELKSLVEEVLQEPEKGVKRRGLSDMHSKAKKILPNFWSTAALVVEYHQLQLKEQS